MTTPSRTLTSNEQARDLLRGLARPLAAPDFRERLRAEFVADPLPARARRSTRARWFVLRPMPAIAALAAAAVAVVFAFDRGPAWRIAATSGTGSVQVDGVAIAIDQTAELARHLRAGTEVLLPQDAQLDLEIPGLALVQITGGSRFEMPSSPDRWFRRAIDASLTAGEIRVATGPRFPGTLMQVRTPEIRAVVTGTTFAVLRRPDASCVCVFEGRVAMTAAGSTDTVAAGFRRSVFRSSELPLLEPILPMESMKLGMLRAQADRESPPGAKR